MLTSSYPAPGDPAWGAYLRDHIRAVRDRGNDVTVLVPSLSRGLKVRREEKGIRVVAYPYSPGTAPMLHCEQGMLPSIRKSHLARLQLPGFLLASIYYLTLFARRERADLIHAHWFIPGGLAAALARPFVRIPLVTLGHGADLHLPDRPIVRRALSFVHRRSDVSLVVSEYLRQRAGSYGLPTEEIDVVRNGVDTKAFFPGRRDRNGERIIGVARRLLPEKRVRDVIRALSGIPASERDKLSLRIAGDGPERRRIEQEVRSLGLRRQVHLLGVVPHREMPEFLRSVDFMINPSIQEGLSVGNLEALSSGLPVIACRGVGSDEAIEDGLNGFLYPPRDVETLRDSIRRMARSGRLLDRMGAAARRGALDRFPISRVGREWDAAYRLALSRNESR
ncbi:MAG: glycosyltransferase [Planctomycetota bacterium]|nr:glycosyltransferase [Planctomycetota bacterium]